MRVDDDGTAIVRPVRRGHVASAITVQPGSSALSRPCPHCGSQPGHACKRLRSRGYLSTVARVNPHPERRKHRTQTPAVDATGLRPEVVTPQRASPALRR